MSPKEKSSRSEVPEITYDSTNISDEKVAEFSAKVMSELIKALTQLEKKPEAEIAVGGFWINTPDQDREQATYMIMENLIHVARLCGVRVVSAGIPNGGRIEDAELVTRIAPILEKKLSPSLRALYLETRPKIKDLLEKTRANNLANQQQLLANAEHTAQPSFKRSILRMLFPTKVSPKVPDTAVLPTVEIEVVMGKKKLGKQFYELIAVAADQLSTD